jgi:glutamate racemase
MIGLFDSGVGGLSVLKELRRLAPYADVLYFGDIANAPYGPKSRDELVALTLDAMLFLRDRKITQFVAACNSVSVSVIRPITEMFGGKTDNIIEMVGPVARSIARTQHGKILVVATQATVDSSMYKSTFSSYGMEIELLAIPELAFAIEQGRDEKALQKILAPTMQACRDQRISTLVLGCTHYPLIKDLITKMVQEEVSQEVAVVDPATSVACETVVRFDTTGKGQIDFILSKDSDVFRRYADKIVGAHQYNLETIY